MGHSLKVNIALGAIVLAVLLCLTMPWTFNRFSSLPDLLAQNTCRLPCWRGITPGQTNVPTALRILAADPVIEQEVNFEEGYELVGYRMIFKRQRIGTITIETQAIGNLIFKDGRVRSVVLVPEPLTLTELLELFGPPEWMLVIEEDYHEHHGASAGGYMTALLYVEQGMNVRVWTPKGEETRVDDTHIRLDPALSMVRELEIFPSAANEELADVIYRWYSSDAGWALNYADAVPWAHRLQPWSGAGPYRVVGTTNLSYFP